MVHCPCPLRYPQMASVNKKLRETVTMLKVPIKPYHNWWTNVSHKNVTSVSWKMIEEKDRP